MPSVRLIAMSNKTIRVQGKGKVSQAPDQIRLTFGVSERKIDFSKAVEGCNARIAILRMAASKCNIDSNALKTVNFNVVEETEYKDGRSHHRGFRADHRVVVILPVDREAVGKFLSCVMSGGSKPQVKVAFEVADAEGLKQRVLAAAVENARQRAETIAESSGIKLGEIANIEYGYMQVRVSSMGCEMALPSDEPELCAGPDFDPDDLEAEDSVTITWGIRS